MADLLHDLLVSSPSVHAHQTADPVVLDYLTSLASLPLASLETREPQVLAQSSHSLLLSLQALSKRSHRAIVESADEHATLQASLPSLAASTSDLKAAIPRLDQEAVKFSSTYHKSGENEILNSRKRALLMSRNVERLVNVLELPTLLSSAITTGSSTAAANYAPALDLNAHIRRLHSLYPSSALVASVSTHADEAMQSMAAHLVASLRVPGLKLASALRTISWLRRVISDLESAGATGPGGSLGALFLVCRLSTLMNMLAALEPLRELADQEKDRRRQVPAGNVWSGGQQTERFLKRYIEIFREQSFAIVSMFKSIFPQANIPLPVHDNVSGYGVGDDPLQPVPSALSTFPLHLVMLLTETLREYLPNVKDQASRDSLLTQVLYCAGSLGRLGGDFGMMLASIDAGEEAEEEWAEVTKRHRLMAGRLESIVGGKDKKASEVQHRP